MLSSIASSNNSPTLLQKQSPQDNTFIDDIDDDESYERKDIGSIDTAHQFLNFSRKVTEASSMRRPVDIQLGIACGKDLLFSPSSRLLQQPRHHQQPKPSLSTLNNINKKPSFTNNNSQLDRRNGINNKKIEPTIKVVLPITTEMKIDEINKEIKHRSLPPLQQKTYNNKPSTTNTTTNSPTSSPLLDRLVADVLNHIDSCPDRSAYSDDLDRLKPKLQAYSVTRLPASLKSS